MKHAKIRQGIVDELPHLRRFAFALTDNPEAADDLLQSSLERALRRTGQWRQEGRLRSWLFRIVYTTHLNAREAEKRHRAVALDTVEGVVGVVPRQESVVHCLDVAHALSQLPVEQRDVVVLVALEDVSYEEAAEILDVPVGTVRSRLSRGRAALRETYPSKGPGQGAVLCRVK